MNTMSFRQGCEDYRAQPTNSRDFLIPAKPHDITQQSPTKCVGLYDIVVRDAHA